jgi:hypothetical protein
MEDYIAAHEHCIYHREEILSSKVCGCFYCLSIFPPSEINNWIDIPADKNLGQTALCPRCEIDSVIGDKSGYPITKDFPKKMKEYWFW